MLELAKKIPYRHFLIKTLFWIQGIPKHIFLLKIQNWILYNHYTFVHYCRSILVAGGAAAIGFMAHKLMTDYEKEEQLDGRAGAHGGGGASTSWGPDENTMGQRKANRAKDSDENLPDGVRCIVCMVNPREIILLPCNHVCLCEDCAEKINKMCPVCNTRIVGKKAVYLP